MNIFSANYKTIYAIEVTKTKLLNSVIRKFDEKKILVTSEHAIVRTNSGMEKATPTDWIIKTFGDSLTVLSNNQFKQLYSKI